MLFNFVLTLFKLSTIYKRITLVYNFVAPLKCIKDTESVDSKMLKTKIGRPILSSKCAVCGSKTSKFIKEQEAKG